MDKKKSKDHILPSSELDILYNELDRWLECLLEEKEIAGREEMFGGGYFEAWRKSDNAELRNLAKFPDLKQLYKRWRADKISDKAFIDKANSLFNLINYAIPVIASRHYGLIELIGKIRKIEQEKAINE